MTLISYLIDRRSCGCIDVDVNWRYFELMETARKRHSRSAHSRVPRTGTTAPKVGTRKRKTSLADALLSRTQQRVIGLLFSHPERSFFAREIIARTAAGSGAVQRELARLAESGLVAVSRIGNQVHYQANREAPIYAELRGIVVKTIGIAEPLREALAPLRDRIDLGLIYGSIANGQDRAASDIDMLVVADDLTLEDLFARLAPLERALGRSIHPTLYTVDEFRRRRKSRNAFLENVLAGETIVLISSDDAAAATRESRP